MNKDILYYLWLAGAFSYGALKPGVILEKEPDIRKFYHTFKESPEAYPFLKKSDFIALGKHTPDEYEKLMEESRKKGISIMCYGDEIYPERLRQIDSFPPVLYFAGDPDILSRRCISIVGTRRPSEYGKQMTYQISRKLATYGIVVISGCAGGIDTAAHTGAVEEGKTVAVLGTPLDQNYPAFNAGLKKEIVKKGGLLITEYPVGTKIHRSFFPIRNRLISGMSDAVLVTEAPEKSGALITASCAADQSKDVFCLPPADISNSRYDGVKKFLRDGARPLLDVEDVLEFYRFKRHPFLPDISETEPFDEKKEKENKPEPKETELSVSEEAKKIFSLLSDRPYEAEELMQTVGMLPNKVFSALTELELADLIVKRGSGYYKKGRL